MDDLSSFIADCSRRCAEDAARAITDVPEDRDAGVVATLVLISDGYRAETYPIAYRPRERHTLPKEVDRG